MFKSKWIVEGINAGAERGVEWLLYVKNLSCLRYHAWFGDCSDEGLDHTVDQRSVRRARLTDIPHIVRSPGFPANTMR
jgi:hypothetical protein